MSSDRLDASLDGLARLRSELIPHLATASSVEEAAGRFVTELHRQWAGMVALARVYLTMPYGDLPETERSYVDALPGVAKLSPGSLMLTLMGTRGTEAAWNHRERSRGHRVIPLPDQRHLDAIPMMSRMLQQLGMELRVAPSGDGMLVRRQAGGLNGVFYVPEPSVAVDTAGRRIIPASEFVAAQAIKTVVGMGGTFLEGNAVVVVVFLRSRLARHVAERIGTLIGPLKLATTRMVSERRIFSPSSALAGELPAIPA